MKAQTRSLMSLCLAVVLVLSAVLGTIAYMTDSSSKTNTFTVGSFNNPTTDPDDPSKTITVNGFIYEKNWEANDSSTPSQEGVTKDNHKLGPGGSTVKDPKVGIGKDSEPAYVYVYIDNKMLSESGDEVYFELNSEWKPVGAVGTDYTVTTVTIGENPTEYYTGGLFKYVGEGSTDDQGQTVYANSILDATNADAWTVAPVFDKVFTNSKVNTSKLTSKDMVVWAFIHQAKDGSSDIGETTIDQAAKDWVKNDVKKGA